MDDDLDALLKWFNLIPPSAAPCLASDLSDGVRMWDVLKKLDESFFVGALPAAQDDISKWPTRWQNLKHISKLLDRYIANAGLSIPTGLDSGSIDLQAIANGDDTTGSGITKVLKMVLLAALNSPNVADYVEPMQSGLDTRAQTSLMSLITQLQQDAEQGSVDGAADQEAAHVAASGDAPAMDQALRYEQQLGKVTSQRDELLRDKQELHKELREMEYRHSRLQENNEILQQKLMGVEDRLREGQERVSEETTVRRMEGRIQNQDDIIAGQEAQLSEFQERIDVLDKETLRLRKENERIQPLQDELDETKVERDAFAKRANMAEKYQQKLHDYADLEKENQLLKGELEEAKFEKGDGSSARTQIAGLQRTLDEYKALLPAIERERHELQMMLKQMERDNAGLGQELDSVKDQLLKAQEQLSELNDGRGPSPVNDSRGGLAMEMEDSERREALEALPPEERSRKLLADLEDSKTELFVQKQLAEDQQNKYTELEKRYEELHSEKISLERSGNRRAASEAGELGSDGDKKKETEPGEESEEDEERTRLAAENGKLRERVRLLESADPALKKAADAALLKQEIRVLRQEMRLMSTAWYDLNSRTHLNNVVLQRRSEPPRGHLKIARELAEQAMAIRAR